MRVVFDIEANGLENPTKIWCIVCKDIDTGELHIFRNVTDDQKDFINFGKRITHWIGHNSLVYDGPCLTSLLNFSIPCDKHTDTYIISKLANFARTSHSLEAYGEELGYPKGFETDDGILPAKLFGQAFFNNYSLDLENYCKRDVEITEKIYRKYEKFINDPNSKTSIAVEHSFVELVTKPLERNGFGFNRNGAERLLRKVTEELEKLDKDILDAFPPKEVTIREFTPTLTKYGTISKTSVPRNLHPNIAAYEAGKSYKHTKLVVFNPSSHKQLIQVLTEAGWQPVNKTKAHIEAERDYHRLRYSRERDETFDTRLKECHDRLIKYQYSGWKIDEKNLETLPANAPASARLLAKRILLESRRRTLTEWLSLLKEDNRIHGKFHGLGAWTHRMTHQNPNTANIANEFDTEGKKKLLGKEMRSLWCAPRNRLLVGVDAEGIQLRIFAHYINDQEFTNALVRGSKADKTDPHSLNQRILGSVCKSRAAAKRFIYALLLGAGLGKLTEILGCTKDETEQALDRLLLRYTGFKFLKETLIPKDARRGYFIGLDGRKVHLPGDTESGRRHLAMSGYLQNGEAVVMKHACLKWIDKLKDYGAKLVNFVHDEWQTECPNNFNIALEIAKMQADSLRIVGEELGLLCPLAGSYYNDDLKDYTIAKDWAHTH